MAVEIIFGPKPATLQFETVYVGLVMHKHGTNIYAGKTAEDVWSQVADFCQEWWDEEGVPGSYVGLPESELITQYFDHAPDDFVTSPQLVQL